MELFATESDRMAYEFERGSDPMDEWRNVMRADHFDPYAFFTECEEHNQSFDIRHDHCTECPVFEPKTVEELILEGYDVPF